MSATWVTIAVALYLLPLAVTFLCRAHPARTLLDAALDVPTVVALDLLSVLLLARFVPLELATLLSRGGWLLGGGVALYRRRARIGSWWASSDKRQWFAPLCAAAGAVFLSTQISVLCGIWDRYWHIPLTGSMRGQLAPFFNIYEEQSRPLYYHYAGDAAAVMLQALSFDHIHTSNALSRAHDIYLGLFGVTVACIAPIFGAARPALALTAVFGMLLAGPVTLLTEGVTRPLAGRATTVLFSLSFRPHVSLAFLLIVGFCAALLAPLLSEGRTPPRATRVCLLASTALLTLSDETSLALLGSLFAVVWLLAPHALGQTRRQATLLGVALLLAIGAVILLLGGTFAPGCPRQRLVAVTPRVPGFMQPSVPLHDLAGWWQFIREFWGVLLVWLAGLIATLSTPIRITGKVFLGYTTLSAIGIGCLLTFEINGGGTECHRFATLPMLLAPLVGLFFATRPQLPARFQQGALVTIPVALGLAFPALSSLEWLFGLGQSVCQTVSMPTYAATDCRKDMGARFGDRPMIAYVDAGLWYEFAGCRPLNAPSPNTGGGNDISMGWPEHGWSAVAKLRAWQGGGAVAAFCSPLTTDPVCSAALAQPATCVDETPKIRRCRLAPER